MAKKKQEKAVAGALQKKSTQRIMQDLTENKETNPFGGGNKRSLYVPVSEVEQEAISRLVEADDIEVHIINWGVLHKPKVQFGDKRLSIGIEMHFTAPPLPMDVYYFDLELRTRSGLVLFTERHATLYGGQPIKVGAGTVLHMSWDIAIARMNPALVKMLVPGATGLTSRLTDKDTGEQTLTGNMDLNAAQKGLINKLYLGEQKLKKMDAKKNKEAKDKATHD